MKRILFVLAVMSFFFGSAWAEPPVYFVDASLQAAVEAELWVLYPTPTEMLELTSLRATERGIADLTGLEYATNLQTLWLNVNEITDLSPLSSLVNLVQLVLHRNPIGDLSPLSGLTHLETLDLRSTRIRDLSSLGGLSNLERLHLHHNEIADISPLSGLTNLQRLRLDYNRIHDISALSNLVHLETLYLQENEVSDISALTTLTSLHRLDVRHNPLNADACDRHIPAILANNPGINFEHPPCVPHSVVISSTVGGSVTDPGEGEFAYDDGDSFWLEAVADPCFVFAGFSGSHSTSQNPTFITINQDFRIRAHFLSTLGVIHVDDDALNDPGPDDSAASDPRENGTLEHPFDSIQKAIDVAADGVSILVGPGVYREHIRVFGKSVQLTATDPNALGTDRAVVIDGGNAGAVVSFTGGRTSGSTLTGIVITRGRGDLAGGLYCDGGSPTVTNCLIVGNRATASDGAAVRCVDSHAVFANCTIADNRAGWHGAGMALVNSPVIVIDCILWGNTPEQILVGGDDEPSITYCCVEGWWPDFGNIDEDPLFARPGHWAVSESSNSVVGPDDPDAMRIQGDYHLKSQAGRWDPTTKVWVRDETTSPCIDAGSRTSPVGSEPIPHGGIVNMGAYGGTALASKSPGR